MPMSPTSSCAVDISTQRSLVDVDNRRRPEPTSLRAYRSVSPDAEHPSGCREAGGNGRTAHRHRYLTALPTSVSRYEEAQPGLSAISHSTGERARTRPWTTLPSVPRSASPSQISTGDSVTMDQSHGDLARPIRPATPTPYSAPNRFATLPRRGSMEVHSTTKPYPYVKDRLHSHEPARSRLVDGWQVFAEDDDEHALCAHETPSTRWTPTAADTQERALVPSRPQGNQFSDQYAPTQRHDAAFLRPEAGPLLHLARHALDNNFIPAASVNLYAHVAGPDSFAHNIAEFYLYLLHMFRDLAEYKKFLSYRDEAAQRLINFLQTLLDYSPPVEGSFRILFVQALLRLSRKAELYPQCFALTDVIRQGEYPVSNGHFGDIYKGSSRGRIVCLKAVKMYKKSNQALLHKAFKREAVLWGQFLHPNVLPFYGVCRLGDTRNSIVLVSPWLNNGNIEEYLEKHPETDRRPLIYDVADGMLYLHNNGVVHGDLKCANILVTDSGRACLADFGLSIIRDLRSLKDKDLSSNAPEGGTLRYQAPELLDPCISSPRSKASDVYAFSIVCYHIITGGCPFSDVKDFAVIFRVVAGERPRRPSERLYLDRGLTDSMWELMKDCWSHAPEKRPLAYDIVSRLPRSTSGERRHRGGWGDLARSRFRASGGYNRPDQHYLSVADMLPIL